MNADEYRKEVEKHRKVEEERNKASSHDSRPYNRRNMPVKMPLSCGIFFIAAIIGLLFLAAIIIRKAGLF